jgi:tubulin-specific chaperone B
VAYVLTLHREVKSRNITLDARCRVASDDARRGTVRFIGDIPEIAAEKGKGGEGVWVGVEYDEPIGRNDGTVAGGIRYFEAKPKCGVFVRAERVEVGDFPALDDLEDMEEI